jgi:hypothetical protein
MVGQVIPQAPSPLTSKKMQKKFNVRDAMGTMSMMKRNCAYVLQQHKKRL